MQIPNELSSRFNDIEVRRQLMAEYGDSDTMFCGENEDGEAVQVSISKDSIIVKTHQKNHWVRVDYYDSEGYYEGESYDGRW